jgi:ABC-type multidrug transport system ATPase subunit
MIELKDVAFGYTERPLCEGVNLTLRRGEIVLMRGRSGCGKTSLLRLLSRFHLPSRGDLFLDGKPYAELRYEELRTRVVYIHQSPVMEDRLPVLENLLLPFSFGIHKDKTRPDEEELRRLCTGFHLPPEVLRREAANLSVGEKQRLAVIRAHLLQPEFMLLDEPLANLDDESAGAIREWIAHQSLANLGLVMASHQQVADLPEGSVRILEITGGRLHERRD